MHKTTKNVLQGIFIHIPECKIVTNITKRKKNRNLLHFREGINRYMTKLIQFNSELQRVNFIHYKYKSLKFVKHDLKRTTRFI